MDLGLEGKKALVTGGSRGLGRAVAVGLAKEGVKVAVVARDNALLSQVVKEMGGEGVGHFALSLDLMAKGAANTLNKKIKKEFGALDIIVHNLGGTLDIKSPFSEVSDYQKVWKFNIGVAIELNGIFLPYMQKRRWGRVVHVSSSAAVMADASLPYCSSKAALNVYVKGLGRHLAKDNIIVTAVMPGPFIFEGNRWDNIAKDRPEQLRSFIAKRMAIGRLGTPEEIGSVIVFLCSQQASFCAGAIIPVDGGIE